MGADAGSFNGGEFHEFQATSAMLARAYSAKCKGMDGPNSSAVLILRSKKKNRKSDSYSSL
jgi:hypothetical protein